jgi:hypothetical protein
MGRREMVTRQLTFPSDNPMFSLEEKKNNPKELAFSLQRRN